MKSAATKREYRQTARADAAQATADRILEVFAARVRESWFEEIRLEDIAREAEVSVPTIVRRFGGKDGLLQETYRRMGQEVMDRRRIEPGDIAGCIRVVTEDYEDTGDLVMRALAQEDRHAPIKGMTDLGRRSHRKWVSEAFSPWLEPLDPAEAERRLDALVIATDVYIWKLVRRDMGRPVSALRQTMARLIAAALDGLPGAPS